MVMVMVTVMVVEVEEKEEVVVEVMEAVMVMVEEVEVIMLTSPAYEPPMRPARSSAVSSGPNSTEKTYDIARAYSFFLANCSF